VCRHIDHDAVPVAHESNRPAVDRLRRDMTDTELAEGVRASAEAAAVTSAQSAPRPAPFMAPVTASISRITGPTLGHS
jgi:hypothetical protein